jgi:hypothetical protein
MASSSSTSYIRHEYTYKRSIIYAYLLNLLGDNELDGVGDKLGVLLDDVLDALLLEVVELVLLQEELEGGATAEGLVDSVWGDGEGTTSSRLPDVLLVVVVLGDHLNPVRNEVGRVEADTELTNHGDVGTSLHGLHECLSKDHQ